MLYFGTEGDYNVMVMEILGPSLENLFTYCEKKFSLATIIHIGKQMIERIQSIHSRGFIHRDIKPDNFLIGIQKRSSIIYTIDFGLSKRFRDPKTGEHVAFKVKKGLTGTARYASLSAQMGYEQSRRDDMEAIGIILVYFFKNGLLPWMN